MKVLSGSSVHREDTHRVVCWSDRSIQSSSDGPKPGHDFPPVLAVVKRSLLWLLDGPVSGSSSRKVRDNLTGTRRSVILGKAHSTAQKRWMFLLAQ